MDASTQHAMGMTSAAEYLREQRVAETLTTAVNALLRERPQCGLLRLSELLKLAAGQAQHGARLDVPETGNPMLVERFEAEESRVHRQAADRVGVLEGAAVGVQAVNDERESDCSEDGDADDPEETSSSSDEEGIRTVVDVEDSNALAVRAVRDDGSSEPAMTLGITRPHYPMFLVSGAALRKLDGLITHEEALKKKLLRRVLRVESEGRKSNKLIILAPVGVGAGDAKASREGERVLGSQVFFISHRWLRPSADPSISHPDDTVGTKLRALRAIVSAQKFLWMDYLCVPQLDLPRKLRAISSLPFYCRCCERFTALVDGPDGRDDYLSRAWCQAELIISKLPERLPHWSARWLHTRGRFYDMSSASGGFNSRTSAILLEQVRDLSECKLTVAADAAPLAPLLEFVAAELQALLDWDASPDRRETRTFGSGKRDLDADDERDDPRFLPPGWKPVQRAQIEAVVNKLRVTLSSPPFTSGNEI